MECCSLLFSTLTGWRCWNISTTACLLNLWKATHINSVSLLFSIKTNLSIAHLYSITFTVQLPKPKIIKIKRKKMVKRLHLSESRANNKTGVTNTSSTERSVWSQKGQSAIIRFYKSNWNRSGNRRKSTKPKTKNSAHRCSWFQNQIKHSNKPAAQNQIETEEKKAFL